MLDRLKDNLARLKQNPPFKKGISLLLFFILFVVLPVYWARHYDKGLSKILPLFYLINLFVAGVLFYHYEKQRDLLSLKAQDIEEKFNVLIDDNFHTENNKRSLEEKIHRYSGLKGIIEDINHNLSLDSIANSLVTIAFSLIAHNKGTCILYLIDQATHKPALFKAKKEDKKLIIKAKEGDIFDLWVLRHTSALLVDDAKNDFRFDPVSSVQVSDPRSVASLVSAPLRTQDRFMGILRLDNHLPGFYSQDDLRLLVTISDFGAVALENGDLFQRTQDLAIHDGLTALFTKGYFLDRLKDECKRSLRKNLRFSLFMVDIDKFKNYNDKFGHTAGDMVLRSVSSVMAISLADFNPVIGRFGGEEFCIIVPDVDNTEALRLASGLLDNIAREKITLRREKTSITVSIGVANFPDSAVSEEDLLLKADRAMYQAKHKGRNQVVVADNI